MDLTKNQVLGGERKKYIPGRGVFINEEMYNSIYPSTHFTFEKVRSTSDFGWIIFRITDHLDSIRNTIYQDYEKYPIMTINSGYRNPIHNDIHVMAQGYYPEFQSRHQWGMAADIARSDWDGDNDGDGDKDDWDYMVEIAREEGATDIESYEKTKFGSWVHMGWTKDW